MSWHSGRALTSGLWGGGGGWAGGGGVASARPHGDLVQADEASPPAEVGGGDEQRPHRDDPRLNPQAGVEAALDEHVEDGLPLLVVAVQDAVRLGVGLGRDEGQAPAERRVVDDEAFHSTCQRERVA